MIWPEYWPCVIIAAWVYGNVTKSPVFVVPDEALTYVNGALPDANGGLSTRFLKSIEARYSGDEEFDILVFENASTK